MATDARTTNRDYPKPHPDNLVSEDFPRLIQALDAIDTDVAGLLTSVAGRAPLVHSHAVADVTGLQAALDAKAPTSHSHALDDLSDVSVAGAGNGQILMRVAGFWQPATLTPTAHTHPITDVTGLQAALDAKLALSGGVVTGNVGFGVSPLTKLDVNGGLTLRSDVGGPSTSHAYSIGANPISSGVGAGGFLQFYGSTYPDFPSRVILGTANTVRFQVGALGQWAIGSDAGLEGQAMVSGGPSAPPTWQSLVPTGVIFPWAVQGDPPDGWLMCGGQQVSRTTYAGLFAAIGTDYGAGDGTTTFNVPDLRGRAPFGKDNMGGAAGGIGGNASRITTLGSGIAASGIGATGGSETVTLTTAQLPAHTHQIAALSGPNQPTVGAENATGVASSGEGLTMNSGAWNTGSQGSGTAHNNMPPAIILNMIIKT